MITRAVSIRAAAALALVAFAAPAPASDYSNQCATADGEYIMDDGALHQAEAQRAGKSKEIKYRRLSEIVLSHTQGYCTGTSEGAKGKRFPFEAKESVITVEFENADGQKIAARLLCQLSSDGTPASMTCGPSVVTSRRILAPTYKK